MSELLDPGPATPEPETIPESSGPSPHAPDAAPSEPAPEGGGNPSSPPEDNLPPDSPASDGADGKPWWSKYSPEYVTEKMKMLPNEEAFVKSHFHLEKKLGESLPKPPGEDATPEQIEKWREFTGVPADPNEYQIEVPEGFEVDEEEFALTKQRLQQANLNNDQANAVIQMYTDAMRQQAEAEREQQALRNHEAARETAKQLRQMWGIKNDAEFSERMGKVDATARKLGVFDALKETGGAYRPELVALVDRFAQQMSEDNAIGKPTAANLDREIEAITEKIKKTPQSDPDLGSLEKRRQELIIMRG